MIAAVGRVRAQGDVHIVEEALVDAPFALPFSLPSSPGVPSTRTWPPNRSITCLSAAPASDEFGPYTLCPQPWPMPGSASYSARNTTVGPGLPVS